ncbi:MAG: peroxide stress protein YaaA [Pseudomonadota bacterium]
MLIVLSPAKTLNFDSPLPSTRATQPALLDQSEVLIETLSAYSPNRLGKLMGISHSLAELNVERNLSWHRPFTKKNARPAMWAFQGDVYQGLQAWSFDKTQIDYGQKHLRILSGLYGLLRPLDLMQPYRLEMGTKLNNPGGKNLYEFWGDKLVSMLNRQLAATRSDTLLNLASNEYFSAVNRDLLRSDIISPVFRDWKNGEYKMISFFAKKARGSMAAWVIKNQIRSSSELSRFSEDGYRFSKRDSKPGSPVFLRKQ